MAGYGILNIIAAIFVPALYACSLVRIIKSRAGDRAIACAGMMLIVFFVLIAALSVPNIPAWISRSLGLLVLLLGLSTLFFLLKRAVDGRRRKQVIPFKRHSWSQLSIRPTFENPSATEGVLSSENETSADKGQICQ
jgi:hypothetical protein